MKKHNFNAGPAILPAEVFLEASEAVKDFNGSGLSLLEMSHRSKEFEAVIAEAEQLVQDLYDLSSEFAVLFLSGGASTQFFMAPMNLLNSNETAGYLDTGTWASKAVKEAKAFGNVQVLASSKAENYAYIPKSFEIPAGIKYLHLTSNNTIFGTQLHHWPETNAPLVVDMSSDIFSRPLDLDRFGMIYAGAQKNMGPAGVTLVIIRKDLVGKAQRHLPAMLDYSVHIENGSMYNTPPVFPIYVSMLTLRWVKKQGGLNAMEAHNIAKGQLFYNELDSNPLFVGNVTHAEDRSLMNATFLPVHAEHEKPFLELCKEAGIEGLKGHRSVGGFRASMYNAMSIDSVQVLVDAMRFFAQKHG
jgi:phosphoserine aminotransferase